jgi:hypothetical protein
LEILPTAFDSFDLPIKVKAGSLGKLHLTIPWRELGTQPSIIRIERLFLLAGPRPLNEVLNFPLQNTLSPYFDLPLSLSLSLSLEVCSQCFYERTASL